jgi:uncharacterized membrane protein
MKRHPLDIVSLVFGLFFAAIGLTFLVSEDPWDLVFDSVSIGWILPFVVLAGGAAMLVSALRPDAKALTDSPLTGSAPSAPTVESHTGAGDEE